MSKNFKKILMLCMVAVIIISAMPVVASAAGGTTYYVASDGTGDGKSESTPMSFLQANGTMLKGGDKMLFKRGDTFYGSFKPLTTDTSVGNRVEFGAYGKGALPTISRAKIINTPFEDAGVIDGKHFYKFDLSKATGVPTDLYTANVGFMEDKNGEKHGIHRKTAAECMSEFDFFSDPYGSNYVYVYSNREPYATLGTLKFNTYGTAFTMPNNIIVHDIRIADAGYGFTRQATSQNIHIYDCVIENIGGIYGYTGDDKAYSTKAGNGVEFFDEGENNIIEYNIFRNIYDVAFTCQGKNPGQWRNIEVRNNIITYCTQAIEIWSTGTDSGDGVNGVNFKNNLCFNNGEGWGTPARGDKINVTDILTYSYDSPIWKMDITNNTFVHSNDYATVYSVAGVSYDAFLGKSIKANNNHIYHVAEDATVFRSQENDLSLAHDGVRVYSADSGNGGKKTISDMSLDVWQAVGKMDTNSTITVIKPKDFSSLDSLMHTSLNFEQILSSAKKVLSVEIVLENSDTSSTPQNSSSEYASNTTQENSNVVSTESTISQTQSQLEQNPSSNVTVPEDDSSVKEVVSYLYIEGETKEGPNMLWLILLIAGVGVVLIAAEAVVIILAIKKKKAAVLQVTDTEASEEN